MSTKPGQAQFRSSYPGDFRAAVSPGVSEIAPVLPASFAWYGDSITQGACNGTAPPTRLLQLLPGYIGVNRGVSGETVSQITTRYFAGMATDCLGEMCGTYIIAGITNDCGFGSCDTDEVLATNLSAVDHALMNGRRVIWINAPPFRLPDVCEGCVGGTYAGILKLLEYNEKMATACASFERPNRANLTCVDVYTPMEEPWLIAADRGYLLDAYACSEMDRVHTSQAGADYLAEMALRAFP